jgi:hypothetical protein
MTEIINLRQQRKAKGRKEKDKKAEQNRAAFGQTKAEKLKKKQEAERLSKLLDGHKRDKDDDK